MPSATQIRDSSIVHGFTSVQSLTAHMAKRLVSQGLFNRVFPESGSTWDGKGTAIFEPTNLVDSLRGAANDKSTWRFAIKVDEVKQTVQLHAATKHQLMDDGTIAEANWVAEKKNPGTIFNFVDREHIKEPQASAVYPMTYALSVSDHGIFFAIWDQAFDERQNETDFLSPAMRWVLIQRPVDNQTGIPYTTGKSPVFCVYTILAQGTTPTPVVLEAKNVGGGNTTKPWSARTTVSKTQGQFDDTFEVNPVLWTGFPGTDYLTANRFKAATSVQIHERFVVCESDIQRPSLTAPADSTSQDANAILNSNLQVATSEDNKYVVTIPKGLNTPRYAYTHELDMIGYTSADVIGEGTEVELPLYGGNFKYKALAANRQRNTGMRILFRVSGEDDPAPAEIEPIV